MLKHAADHLRGLICAKYPQVRFYHVYKKEAGPATHAFLFGPIDDILQDTCIETSLYIKGKKLKFYQFANRVVEMRDFYGYFSGTFQPRVVGKTDETITILRDSGPVIYPRGTFEGMTDESVTVRGDDGEFKVYTWESLRKLANRKK